VIGKALKQHAVVLHKKCSKQTFKVSEIKKAKLHFAQINTHHRETL